MNKWLLAYTKPRQEHIACHHLQNQGIQYFCPMAKINTAKSKAPVLGPLFPRYIFINLNYKTQSLTPIRSTRGMADFVYFEGRHPAEVPDHVIESLQNINNRPLSESLLSNFQVDMPVRIRLGDSIVEALLKSKNAKGRIQVLFETLGKPHLINLSENALLV